MTKELTSEQLEFRSQVYGIIGWTCLAIILIWYILKSVGVIQTPLWLELMPVAAGIFAGGAFVQKICSAIAEMKKEIILVKVRVTHLEKDMHFVKAQI